MTGEIIVLWVIVFYRKWQLNVVPYHKGGGGICAQHNRESTTELRKLVFDTSTSQWPVALKWKIWHIEMSVFSPELSIILSTFLVARNRLFIWPSITWTLNWDKAINRTKNKNVSKQRGFELPNMSFYRFCSFGTGERVQLIECLNKGLHGVRFSTLQLVKLSRVNCMIHFVEFLWDLYPLLA